MVHLFLCCILYLVVFCCFVLGSWKYLSGSDFQLWKTTTERQHQQQFESSEQQNREKTIIKIMTIKKRMEKMNILFYVDLNRFLSVFKALN